MNFYDVEIVNRALEQTFAFIKLHQNQHTLQLTLSRPDKRNALHPHMINEIAFAMQYAKTNKDIWVLLIDAEGDVFCSGADLKAFMGELGEFTSSIPLPKQEILVAELFHKLHKPSIVNVSGDVFAGGMFFLAGCTYVVAHKDIKLGLPEVKRGLYPFQVMAALLEIMPKRKVVDWCIRGYNLVAQEAKEFGLVTHLVASNEIDETIEKIIGDICANAPYAIHLGLEALDTIESKKSQHQYLMEMLKKTIRSKDAQEGIQAFKEKRKPNWKGE